MGEEIGKGIFQYNSIFIEIEKNEFMRKTNRSILHRTASVSTQHHVTLG